jgi:hypothetical protein
MYLDSSVKSTVIDILAKFVSLDSNGRNLFDVDALRISFSTLFSLIHLPADNTYLPSET